MDPVESTVGALVAQRVNHLPTDLHIFSFGPSISLHFYTPVKDGALYAVPSVCLSGRPSVHQLTFHVRSITLIPFKIFS